MHPKSSIENPPRRDGRGSLLTGGVAAILASACCVGPLVLLAFGVSGAWIGTLTALEPYRPLFIALAVASLVLAWRHIWRPVATCPPGAGCAVPPADRLYKLLFAVVTVLVLIALVFPAIAPWFY
ncbi:MAG: mercuric ion transporter MerT [Steroidobacteraceae bacterium]|uniref:mercuric ion transporter MerT n=1 Tax=Aromatoleum sp. (strain CIB) TaxID=198107 RepID=UPI00067E4879|nr:mercuric ion transporter MerT [Azoarcus sp. CIB]AKU11578.1 putative mercuric transport protein [Azoarcus sp. CIB]MCM2313502.1 mercuric ion transporter MerT [Steroidobacteraceae bacterium]